MVLILPFNSVAVLSAGYYLYFESSPPVKTGDAVRLISPLFTPPYVGTGCFSFWFHMYGSDIGRSFSSLRVFLQDVNVRIRREIFVRSKNQGNQWMYGQANVTTEANQTVCIIWIYYKQYTQFSRSITIMSMYSSSNIKLKKYCQREIRVVFLMYAFSNQK